MSGLTQVSGSDSTPILADSHLVKLIRNQLTDGTGANRPLRTLFVPWYGADERESESSLKTIARLLDVPLITLRSHYSMTHDARLLARLVELLCPGDGKQLPLRALKRWPYSAMLEDSILNHIAQCKQVNRVAIGSVGAGSEADSLVSRMLDWARAIDLNVALVFAHRRPTGIVETVDLPVRYLRQDILKLLPVPAPQPSNNPQARDPPFYVRLVNSLKRRTSTANASIGAAATLERQTDPDWADLLARLSGSNWVAALATADAWRAKDESTRKRIGELRTKERELKPDNFEEVDALDGRLRFLAMLRVLYPEAFDTAAHEIDGADQLYRVHLILCGATAKETLLSSSLLPYWRQHLADPLFCEIFYACFLNVGGGQPLVERFESRSQLHRLLSWPPAPTGEGGAKLLQEMTEVHQRWLRDLAEEDSADIRNDTDVKQSRVRIERANLIAVSALIPLARQVLVALPTASDALQAAQVLISVRELLQDKEAGAREEMHDLVAKLTDEAINQSRGAIRVDASLLRARTLALRNDPIGAFEILRIVRRMSHDALGRCATQIEEAFVHECSHDFMKAVQLYEEAVSVAEELGADELVARASSGCLRCNAAANAPDQKADVRVRARIILQIQSARAPELFPMTERSKPTLFISYRAETRRITRAVVAVLNERNSPLSAWGDVKLKSNEDFNPTIHRRLHDADAIVLLLSPDYFRSPWCVHELHFALSQHEVRGVPLCWAWCQPLPKDDAGFTRDRSETLAKKYIKESFNDIDQSRWGYEIAHVEERLSRLFARGRRLQKEPTMFTLAATSDNEAVSDEPTPDEIAKAQTLCAPLFEMAPHLYRRARLPLIEKQGKSGPSHDAPCGSAQPGSGADVQTNW